MSVPILLILFNRPNHARQVVDRLRQVRPEMLYVAIDGPRKDNANDIANVTACKALLNEIDWPCTVQKLFRTENLGCKFAVSSAITWFFDNVERGIILEDDCLPEVTFFNFCDDLLTRYELNEQVMHIGGANLFPDIPWRGDSYRFTKVCHIWGWATWRRAWQHYDVAITEWQTINQNAFLKKQLNDLKFINYWKKMFTEVSEGKIDTWDYQWVFAIWLNNGLSILPKHNLVKNTGFDDAATHTLYKSPFANLSTIAIQNIVHPDIVAEDRPLTIWLANRLYRLPSFLDILRMKIELRLKRIKL